MTKETTRFAGLNSRGPSAEALAAAISEMSAEELLASASDEVRAELSAPASKPKANEAAAPKPGADDKGGEAADGDGRGAKAEATDRSAEVFASEHSQGRERMAADCLSAFPGASAAQIVGFLAKQPQGGASDDDAAQGREMLDEMKKRGNADLGNQADAGAPSARAKAASVWDRARKANSQTEGN